MISRLFLFCFVYKIFAVTILNIFLLLKFLIWGGGGTFFLTTTFTHTHDPRPMTFSYTQESVMWRRAAFCP